MSTPGLPAQNESYSKQEYWEQRYQEEIDTKTPNYTFDWFKSYRDITKLVHEIIPNRSSRILMLGCGNSSLSQEMYEDGYINITNVDYSTTVIQMMKSRHQSTSPSMEWQVMDVRDLKFEDESFDVVMDKGTMDAMLAVDGSLWNPPEEAVKNCTKEVSEALRVLKSPKGVFFYLTFGQPHFRKRYMQPETHPQCKVSMEVRTLGQEDAFHYFAYIVQKEE